MKKKKRKYYAFQFMFLAEVLAGILLITGYIMRYTIVKDMPQYNTIEAIALPMMVLKDHKALKAEKMRHEAALLKKETEKASTQNDDAGPSDTEETGSGQSAAPTAAPTATPTPESKTIIRSYLDEPVEESFFDHTLFIGDSKTDELMQYGRIGQAKYFCDVGYSVFNIFSETLDNPDFTNKTLEDALKDAEYDQIYIMLGYNEASYPLQSLFTQYEEVLEYVLEAQPQASIILHAVMHASEEAADNYPELSPEHLEEINTGILQIAERYDQVYYLDCNDAFCDENGYLSYSVSNDGEHLTPENSKKWSLELRKRVLEHTA